MAYEQTYLETTQATKWCENVNELLSETNSLLKNASQLMQDLGAENTGTLGSVLQQQGNEFINAFDNLVDAVGNCVKVFAAEIIKAIESIDENKSLLAGAAKILGKILNI